MASRHTLMRRACVIPLVGVLVSLLAGANPPAQAAPLAAPPTFIVNSVADLVAAPPLNDGICASLGAASGVCTLRAAIMKANHYPGGHATIVFASHNPGTIYALTIPLSGVDDETSGDLNITASMSLVGNGAGVTLIDGNNSVSLDRVVSIGVGATVSLTGVTLQRGHVTTSSSTGGGLLNAGQLTMDHSAVLSSTVFSDPSGGRGGGIFNEGTLTLTNSLIQGNGFGTLYLSGGGLADGFGGRTTLINTTVAGNHADYKGGGIDNADGTLAVSSSTLSGNTAAAGGGLANQNGSATLVNSTLSGNSALTDGGGLWNSLLACACGSNQVRLFNVTIADNQADADFNGSGTGGGIFNQASIQASVQIQNSLLADNSATFFLLTTYYALPEECSGTLTSQGYNLVSNLNHCTLAGGGPDQTTVYANLDLLQNNGGPTLTQALRPGSPAIDAGNPGGCNDPLAAPLASDQRGAPRPANGAGATLCDIGAFELQRTLSLPLLLR